MTAITITKEVDVDVDFDDFSTDELVTELTSRGMVVLDEEGQDNREAFQDEALNVYYAFASSDQEKAIQLCKELVESITGRNL